MSSRKKSNLFAMNPLASMTRGARPTVTLAEVRTDGGTQPRVQLDDATLAEYSERMAFDEDAGAVVDPEGKLWEELVVFTDEDDTLWLADGFHRMHAAIRAGLTEFQVHFEAGSQREAVRHSLGANATHGKRRTNADKRRAVERALGDIEWATFTDARVAELCKVTKTFVGNVRRELESKASIPFQEILVAADGREFERTPPATPNPVKAHTRAVSAPVIAAIPPQSGSRITRVSFDDLSGLEDLVFDTVVAYPTHRSAWSALTAALDGVLSESGQCFVHPIANSELVWWGPMQLDSLVQDDALDHPSMTHIRAHDRVFMRWTRQGKDHVSITSGSTILIVGESLDDWFELL